MEPCHTLQRNWQKTVADYSNHSLNYFRLIVVSPSPSLTSNGNDAPANSFGVNSHEQSVEIYSK